MKQAGFEDGNVKTANIPRQLHAATQLAALRRAVELVELVLRLLQELHSGVVLLHELDVLAVLLFPLLCRFGNLHGPSAPSL